MLPSRMFFDDMLSDLTVERNMKCDIYEKDNKVFIEMDVPGYDKKDIKVECNKGNLIVSAEKKHEEEEKDEKKKYLRRERVYGKYSRSFYLGDVDEENIEASYNNGTLHIAVPKIDENKNRKLIDIK